MFNPRQSDFLSIINLSINLSIYQSKLYQIIEGSSNILKMIIAQDALNICKANR